MTDTCETPVHPCAFHAAFAGWSCGFSADCPTALEILSERLDGYRAPGAARTDAHLHLRSLAGRTEIQVLHAGRPADCASMLQGPEWKQFVPVADPVRRLWADTVHGPEPRLEIIPGGLRVLDERLWPVYAELLLLASAVRQKPLALLHAATCALEGTSLLILGPSGAGKSTLCWALRQQGAAYYNDEFVGVSLPDLRLHVVPRRLALRPGGVQENGLSEPEFWYEGKPGDLKCLVPVRPANRPLPQREVMFLFADGFHESPALGPMPGGEAVRRLLSVMSLGKESLDERLDAAADLVERFPCVRLRLGHPAATAALIAEYLQCRK